MKKLTEVWFRIIISALRKLGKGGCYKSETRLGYNSKNSVSVWPTTNKTVGKMARQIKALDSKPHRLG